METQRTRHGALRDFVKNKKDLASYGVKTLALTVFTSDDDFCATTEVIFQAVRTFKTLTKILIIISYCVAAQTRLEDLLAERFLIVELEVFSELLQPLTVLSIIQ